MPRNSTAERIAALAKNLPPAAPGIRSQSGSASDNTVTSRIERVSADTTPAPLPPSPAADAADVWFEQVPTNPAAVPDLEVLSGSRPDLKVGSGVKPLAAFRKPADGVVGADADDELWSATDYSGPQLRPTSPSWLLQILLAATCLAVGMVLGALLFGGSSESSKTSSDAGVCDCRCPEDGER